MCVLQIHMAAHHPLPHWEPWVLVPLEDLAAQHSVSPTVVILKQLNLSLCAYKELCRFVFNR